MVEKNQGYTRQILTILVSSLVFIVAVIGTVALVSYLKTLESTTNDTPQQPASPLRANVDEKKDFTRGSTAQFGYFEVKINKVTTNYTPEGGLLPVTKGSVFLLLNISAKNIDTTPHLISDIDLAVLNDEALINASFTKVTPAFKNGAVEPGVTMTGNLLYEVPANKTGLKLYYNTRIYNADEEKLQKNEYILAF